MKKALYYTLLLITIVSCTTPNPENYIQYIDGYWEIERVVLSDGTEKKYNFNQSIDFFEIKDSIGIRKKVQPRLDGSFITTNDSELFTLKIEDDSLRMYYKTPLSSWKETIISAKENQITVKNEAGNVYFYKSYQKIQL
ncbi:lipocalin family protein [Aquimarina sp. 2304DJ70-9]|uniref:lipocalin family protein n=1 Tax=Aquimarina penaris TaxID=3231044 RepID=UPI0034636696